MPLPIVRYPLDTTGLNLDNLVSDEIHTLSNKPVRAIAPTYGAFYTESLKIFDLQTQRQLVKGTQYLCTELLQTPTELYGKEICYLILIIDPAISNQVLIQYQVLGGLYTRSGDAIINIYETIMRDERPVNWVDVLNKPLGYAPSQHFHDSRDIYGFEYLVTALERIRNAIVSSNVPAYERVMDWLSLELDTIRNQANFPTMATTQEAIQGIVNDKYMSPLRVKEVLDKNGANKAKNYFLAQL